MIELIDDREFERDFRLDNGRIITIEFDEWSNSMKFKENGEYIGDEFIFIDEWDTGERFLLGRMYSPVKKSGLGREVIKFFIDITGASIYTRPHDGIVRDDGSHLTEEAPGFVRKMQEEGLIEKDTIDE